MTTLLHKLTVYLAVAFFVTSFMLFITDTSGDGPARGGVIGEAAREGQIEVPVQQRPGDLPGEFPAELPAETPADAPAPAEEQGGGGQ